MEAQGRDEMKNKEKTRKTQGKDKQGKQLHSKQGKQLHSLKENNCTLPGKHKRIMKSIQ
jgi:hypothetical protein